MSVQTTATIAGSVVVLMLVSKLPAQQTTWIQDTGTTAHDEFSFQPVVVRGQTPVPIILPPTSPFDAPQPTTSASGWLGNTFLSSTKALIKVASPELFGVSGAFLNRTFDSATLLQSVPGINLGTRAKGNNELHIQGRRFGQSNGEGSYWFPARQDLDTMLSKIDASLVDSIVAIKGPYSALYGPGLSFFNVDLLDTPRYANGFESHGNTTLEYETNGEQWHSRQTFHGGSTDWGYRVGYSHRTGSDYETGGGVELPSSYKSRILDVALGANLTGSDNLEIHAFRLDQTDIEFPGQWFDINFLVTEAYDVEYTIVDQPNYDTLAVEGWYNRTRFEGDNSRQGKHRLNIPGLFLPSVTDVDAMSTGYRAAISWNETAIGDLTAGTDLRYLSQRLNETTTFFIDHKSAIPASHSSNPGVFWETKNQPHEWVSVQAGGRADWVSTNADNSVAPITTLATSMTEELLGELDQHFLLWSLYASGDVVLTNHWTINASAGHAMRPPTLTELYAANAPFIAALPQTRGTSVIGDPNLRPERAWQIDLGLSGSLGQTNAGLHGFYSWINDYVTLDMLDNGTVYAYTNTDLATLSGFDAFADFELSGCLKAFGSISYVEGRDRTRNNTVSTVRGAGRAVGNASLTNRSEATTDREPLPVFPPLESRLGLTVHEPNLSRWSVDFSVRLANHQHRVATSLLEEPTEAYAAFDIRGYAQLFENMVMTAGVLNVTDADYRTYFDSRRTIPGDNSLQVFQPGISFYFGSELIY